MFTKSAAYYDAICAALGKDYAAEARLLYNLIRKHNRSPGNRLLDVGCGPGGHVGLLRDSYEIEGLDLDEGMLDIARRSHPDVRFHVGDMLDFHLGRRFDVVVCLASTIGYVMTVENMGRAIANMSRHLEPGGLLIVEPWLTPDVWRPGTLHSVFVDEPELKVARVDVSDAARGRVSVMDFHYLVATSEGVEYFEERHEMGLFTHDEYLDGFRCAGLKGTYYSEGLKGLGI